MQYLVQSYRRLAVPVLAVAMAMSMCLLPAKASFIIEIDTDGADDGVLTFNPNFSFGGDTTSASQSETSTATWMTGGDSIFGGNGVASPDTYVFTYNPSVDADNLAIAAGTDIADGNLASGLTGGGAGIYAVYATWPNAVNVSGGLTQFSTTTAGDSFSTSYDQNANGDGPVHKWYKLGEINWSSGPITVTQQSTSNTFVSMRAAGVMFEQIPEPSTLGLLAVGLLALGVARRRR